MDRKKLNSMRSEVIERSIEIELLMSGIICVHYFGRINMPFWFEVLYDENFSFAMKRRILEKIAPLTDRRTFDELNRIGTIRNYFAHRSLNFVDFKMMKLVAVDPKRLDRTIDFESLFQEFSKLHDRVHKHFEEILVAMGKKRVKEMDDIIGARKM
jgi:hypothetical protein